MVVGLLVACGGTPGDGPPVLPGTEPPPCELESSFFLIDDLLLPATDDERRDHAFNLDGKPPDNGTDNQIGQVAQFLRFRFNIDLSPPTVQALADRALLWAVEVQICPAGEDPDFVRVMVHRGLQVEGDTVVLASDDGVPAEGTRDGAGLIAVLGAAAAPLSALLDAEAAVRDTAWVDGLVLALRLSPDNGGFSGSLGIAHEIGPAQQAVLAPIARTLSAIVVADSGCPEACLTPEAADILDEFDTDATGDISESEVAMNPLMESFFVPDVDLTTSVDGVATYWPGQDGILDHISLNLGLHASPIAVSW